MAKIFLTGDREPLMVENEKAMEIERDLLDNVLPQTIKIAGTLLTNAPRQIKMIRLDNDFSQEEKEDLYTKTTQELKEIIGNWEEKRSKVGNKYIQNNILGHAPQGLINLYEKQGAITKVKDEDGNISYAVVMVDKKGASKYLELQRKEQALRVLNDRRFYARNKRGSAKEAMQLHMTACV